MPQTTTTSTVHMHVYANREKSTLSGELRGKDPPENPSEPGSFRATTEIGL